ncbi:MAG: hypothetical protein M3P94_05930, partial [Chloroflexota bacterium]|nr:hypothetical protein [Chloroflexota bacterium]
MADSRETYRPAYSRSHGDGPNGDDPALGTTVDLVPGRTALAVIAFPVLHVGDSLPHPAGLEMPPLLFWGIAGTVVLLAGWLVIDLLPASRRHAGTAPAGDDLPDPGEPLIIGRGRGRAIPAPLPGVISPETALPGTARIDPGAEPLVRRHDDVSLVSRDLVIAAGETREWRPPPDSFLAIAG